MSRSRDPGWVERRTDLVRTNHVLVEDLHRDLVDERVSDPSPVMSVRDFAILVGTDFGHSDLVGFLVALDGDLSGHSAHGRDFAPVNVARKLQSERKGSTEEELTYGRSG